ncbi:MAG: hypothetical protein LLG04_03315, partial [Parachlamydia sp.]|nr:hypothetical protein [Parachlamydia sp.]
MSIASSMLLNPLGAISAIVSTLEAGLYSHVEAGVHHEGRVVRWIRSTTIAHFRVIQTVMSVANSILFLIPTYILTENMLTKLELVPIYPKADNFVFILGWSCAALAATVALGAFILHRLSRTPKRQVGEVEITT